MSLFQDLSDWKPTGPAAIALAVVLVAAWLVYAPGLSGDFLFDDWVNLPPLGAFGPVDNWHTLVTYLLSGIASATGRPLAMLSFLIDANNWPAAPEPFKYTNVMIQLLNGVLLAWLTFKLARLLKVDRGRAAWAAVLSAGLWLLHPLMVSTTLFVVQRMAMLAATFVFSGLLCYLYGRRLLLENRARAGYLWMSAGVGLCGLLAALSKENGALLPLFVIIIDGFVLEQPGSELRISRPLPGWRLWRAAFVYLPLGLLAGYLLWQIPGMLHNYADYRDFTLGERLLTEARILVHYLYVLLVPRAYTAGLFNDNITLSTGLFHPWTTLPASALIAGLLVLGWRTRRRYPALGLAIFFYFGGQLLESTFVPLELYFEHRNYLPAALLFFPLALWVVTGPRLSNRSRTLIGAPLLGLLAVLTWSRASLWGHPFQQAIVWARENPRSPRAQTTLSLHLMHRGEYAAAAVILERVARSHPDDIMVQLNLLNARCAQGGIRPK
ncbi:MAG TPA: tetratricopeptide repeat protein, partial [Gammaproteobacteria bacterium]|nr:tetratricopeptide repeat protein [Gammaproteobacteria bacterium]